MAPRALLIAILVICSFAVAQPTAAGPDRGVRTAKASAPMDLAGYWVSYVTEEWRFRMITPRKGDYGGGFSGLPMTEQARKIADAWDPAADEASGNQCKAYGAAAIMRIPARFHVSWQDDNTLRVDSDAGMQTRIFHFDPPPPLLGERTRQGYSAAQWESGSLKVVSTNVLPGYLRKNGVPYGEKATVTEYFELAPFPDGGQLLMVTTIVNDPQYLTEPFIVSSQFKREADGSKWDPTECTSR